MILFIKLLKNIFYLWKYLSTLFLHRFRLNILYKQRRIQGYLAEFWTHLIWAPHLCLASSWRPTWTQPGYLNCLYNCATPHESLHLNPVPSSVNLCKNTFALHCTVLRVQIMCCGRAYKNLYLLVFIFNN